MIFRISQISDRRNNKKKFIRNVKICFQYDEAKEGENEHSVSATERFSLTARF